MKEENITILLENGDSLEVDMTTLLTNCSGLKNEIFITKRYDENDEEGKYTKYSIKYKQNGVLLQMWADSYEIIPLKKLKEIVEE